MVEKIYQKPFIKAVSLHVLFFIALTVSFTFAPANIPEVAAPAVEIVKAVAVNQQAVEQEIKRRENELAQQKRAEQQRIKKLEQQALAAKKQREKEQALAKKALEAKQKAEQEMKKQQQLAAEKRKREQQQAKQELAKQQALAEKAKQERIKQQQEAERLQRLAEEQALADKLAAERQTQLENELSRIRQAISQEWRVPDVGGQDISATILIRMAPDGTVLKADVVKSSGDRVLDNSAQTAVYKASPLPVPEDRQVYELLRTFRLTVRPNGDLITG